MSTPVRDPLVGRVLDRRYRITRRIARGGMATVYAATDDRLDRPVAVKVMHPWLAQDDAFVHRFTREARAAASLTSPHAVAVHDQGVDDDVVFLVMELVPGRTLRDVLEEQGALDRATALAVLDPVVQALAAAHDRGLVHRDVKPENVLITPDGRVKVADFGLARAVTESSGVTSALTGGALLGTVAYVSPEQVERGTADPRSDVYAVGVVLFELLTGEVPFAGGTALSVAFRHVHDDVPPPSGWVDGVPPAVDELVLSATSRDPELRPADAGDLLDELRAVARTLDEPPVDLADILPAAPAVALRHTAVVPGAREGRAGPAVLRAGQDGGARGGAGPLERPGGDPDEELDDALDDDPGARHRATVLLGDSGPHLVDPRRRRRRITGALLALLLVAAAAGGAGWWWGAGPGRYTSAPSVLGAPLAQARATAHASGLDLRVTQGYSETVPDGRVISQQPDPRDRVERDGSLAVVVSRGAQRVDAPSVVGDTEADARTALQTASLTVGAVTSQYDDDVPTGRVVSADPVAGDRVRPGTPVDLVLSQGPTPVDVPSVVGRASDDAQEALRSAGFSVRVRQDYSDTVDEGDVVSQDPASGQLPPGGTVSVVVSRGPQLFAVPDVEGQDAGDAEAALRAAGFDARVLGGRGRVLQQVPGGGSLRVHGTTVTLIAGL